MINRFHNAAPSVAIAGANSQANKAKAGDGFALLLNALSSPVAEQQSQQHPTQLLQEPIVKLEPENAAPAFNRFVDAVEEAIDPSANNLFVATSLPAAIAVVSPLIFTVQTQLQPELSLSQPRSSALASEIPVTQFPIATVNEVAQTALPSMTISLNNEVPTTTVILSEIAVVPEPANFANFSIVSAANETSESNLTAHNIIDVHTAISKHSATQSGDVELVAMPWRLQANAAMSYQSTAQQLKNMGDTQSVLTPTVHVVASQVGDKNPLLGLSNNGSQYDGVKIDKAMAFYRISESASTLANAFEGARSLRSDSRGSLIMWPQRVLHWLADGDATTAWVRDYQLDASGARTLVDALRCFAEQQDFSLRRIMLNGHEVWRSPSTF